MTHVHSFPLVHSPAPERMGAPPAWGHACQWLRDPKHHYQRLLDTGPGNQIPDLSYSSPHYPFGLLATAHLLRSSASSSNYDTRQVTRVHAWEEVVRGLSWRGGGGAGDKGNEGK